MPITFSGTPSGSGISIRFSAGYPVWLGEVLLTLAVILLTALLCSRSKTAAAHAMVILVLVFTAGITVCFIAAAAGGGLAGSRPEPAFIPDRSSFSQVLRILFISPWAFIGFFYFHRIITKDHARRFGKAIIVWIALLAVIILMALIWSGRTEDSAMTASIQSVSNYYRGTAGPALQAMSEADFLAEQVRGLHATNTRTTLVVVGLFGLSLFAMLINHLTLRKYEAETKKERDIARNAAYRDPLTGVRSKHAWVEEESRMAEKIYNGEAGEFAVVVCDVNGLKHINDTLGHKAGDTCICSACKMICEYYDHSPVFRIGGDEFAVILAGQDYENRHEILRRFNGQVEQHVGTNNVVASLGMAEYDPEGDNTFHAVFARADAAMYERKQELKAMGARTRD